MPLMEVMGLYAKSWIMVLLIFLPLAGFLIWTSASNPLASTFGAFLVGTVFGRIGRDIAHCRAQTRIWPIVREVLSWERIDSKLAQLFDDQEQK